MAARLRVRVMDHRDTCAVSFKVQGLVEGYKLIGFVLRLNEDRLSGLRFISGILMDRSGAKGSSHSVGTWMERGRVCKDGYAVRL